MRSIMRLREQETGLGLAEVLVSMMLLAVIAVVFLPIVVQGVNAAVVNNEAATAVQTASRELDSISRGGVHRCEDLQDTWFAGSTRTEPLAKGGHLRVSYSGQVLGGACSGGEGIGNARLQVTVTDAGGTRTYADPSTIVRVENE